MYSQIAPPNIFIDEVIGEAIKGHIQSQLQCRILYFQHSSASLTVQQAQQKAQYLYTVDANKSFILYFDQAALSTSPYVAIVAECDSVPSPVLLNYQVRGDLCCKTSERLVHGVACNSHQLQISEVSQLKDSCIYVTLQYEGSGEYYVINRAGNNNPVDAMNIIHEGIYLGLYLY